MTSPIPRPCWHLPPVRGGALLAALFALVLAPAMARAGVQFVNCAAGEGGSITCDTVPTGNTYLDDKAAQYGLFNNASPGWNEFDPYQGFDQELGDGED